MATKRDPTQVEPLKLTDIDPNSDYINLLYSLKETTLANSLQTKPKAGYEFEGMTYLDGKQLKQYKNSQWETVLDFSVVNYSDITNTPVISNDDNETDLTKLPTFKVLRNLTNPQLKYFFPDNYGNNTLSHNTAWELTHGRMYSSGSVWEALNDYSQVMYSPCPGVIEVKGICVLGRQFKNQRIHILYRQRVPNGYIITNIQLTPIGVGGGAGVQITAPSDTGYGNALDGFYVYVYDPSGQHEGWTSNPGRNYSDKEYRFYWTVTHVNKNLIEPMNE